MTKLNKITSVLLSAIMVIGIFSIIPFAAGAESGKSGSFEYYYYVLYDGTASITKYIDNGSKTVDIPSTIDGYKVTEIGGGAFYGCTGLKSVTIPSSVTEIGWSAFGDCTGLTSINIPNSVTEIGYSAFFGCTSLKSVTIPSSVAEICGSAFGYYYDNNGEQRKKVNSFTIYGKKGTAAERYAKDNGFKFVEGTAPAEPAVPTGVKLNQSSLTLGKGESYGLVNTVLPANAKNKTCTWSTSNSSAATVSNTGKVTAKAVGTAMITVKTVNGKTATCKVTVKPAPTSVKINPTALTLGKGESYTVNESTSKGSYANGANLKWTSTNTRVATVQKGKGNKAVIKAVGTGTANIKITLFNGKTDTCKVTVKPAPTSVKINPTALTLGKGESYTVNESTSKGSYANGANLKWTSTNTRVATVQKGKGNKAVIKAVGTGTASIKITLFNGKTATCKVTVKPAPTSVKINPTALTLGKGESYTISESTSKGSYANGANLKWTSTNTRVATVQKGKGNKAIIKAVGTGTANIKITLFNGKTATCKVTVKPAPTSVKINPTALTLGKGESYTVSESTSKGSYANGANLKWTSSNTRVATVQKGKGNKAVIKAVGTGTSNIKITLFNGKTATCKVTVKPVDPHEGKTYHEAVTKKVWVEPEYKTVHHPAVTKKVNHPAVTKRVWVDPVTHEEPVYKTVGYYVCHQCGARLNDDNQLEEHYLDSETCGSYSYKEEKVQTGTKTVTDKEGYYKTETVKDAWTETVVVKEAWMEKVLVKEGYYKTVVVKEAGWY